MDHLILIAFDVVPVALVEPLRLLEEVLMNLLNQLLLLLVVTVNLRWGGFLVQYY